MNRIVKTAATHLAVFAAGAAAAFALFAGHGRTPAPAACHLPDASYTALPSGDAARINGHAFVCTDGTWIHVTGYGS